MSSLFPKNVLEDTGVYVNPDLPKNDLPHPEFVLKLEKLIKDENLCEKLGIEDYLSDMMSYVIYKHLVDSAKRYTIKKK